MPDFIRPRWPAPPGVRALSTTRCGGVSLAPWDSLNLGLHVGDDPRAVEENRRRLREAAGLPSEPLWLEQVHGTLVLQAGRGASCRGDARFTNEPGVVCAVMTADCLPVLLCDTGGTAVAAVHAGWRGLLEGVVEAALDCFEAAPSAIMAWLGPAIGPEAFEVGGEVREAFIGHAAEAEAAFRPAGPGKWRADLYRLARQRLAARGVVSVHGGGFCTFGDPERFFSYRRDGRTGRMASLIWLQGDEK